MSRALHTSRRTFSARTTLAAAVLAVACGGCAFDQSLAGLGNIFGAPAEAKTAGNAQDGRLAAAKRAVAAGADAKALRQELSNAINGCGEHAIGDEACTCLFKSYAPAAVEDRLEAARFLLDNGADVNQDNGDYVDGNSPLGETLSLLGQMNITCHYDDDETSANTLANIETASEGVSKMATLLVSRGADVKNSEAGYGPGTSISMSAGPLSVAIKYGNLELVRILIEKGADVNKDEECQYSKDGDVCTSVLEVAAFEGKAEVVKLLLEKGAKKGRKEALATAQSGLKSTEPEAQKAQYREIISLLQSAGAKSSLGNKKAGTKKRK